jgi:acyl transferase domain-containing protein/thioesterase domain-containing protein/acyl carrier protein
VGDEARLREYLDKAAIDLRKTRRRLRELEQSAHEPIAILGVGCRYPGGANTPGRLWEMLAAGADAISPFPDDRGWDLERLYNPDPDNPGTTFVREGGFLADVADFDPAFFGITPREAQTMDPQQRLLLETSWEALEDAGVDFAELRGSQTGVFVGAGAADYGQRLASAAGAALAAGALIIGSSSSVISGRISYSFGLEGPAMTVDTACSSSLVALHLAVQALRGGECSLALAGGVAVMSTPVSFVDLSSSGGMARDGRCKAFADAADGAGFSEGVGALVLERLTDARRNGHPVLAVIRGSAVNQDGASNGLSAPNGPSQERVIRQALANAGLSTKDVDAVEAHGTGTPLGDPIEAGALLATYGRQRETPLRLGSIKSNIGHTAAAAGVAGVIKMVMALRAGVMPKTLHVDSPSAQIDWSAGSVELLTEAEPWPSGDRPRRAGVSSFGVSGTNAHVILEEAPAPKAVPENGSPASSDAVSQALPGPTPVVLSAKSDAALAEAAAGLVAHLEANPDLEPVDVGFSRATTRPRFEHRAVAPASDRRRLLERLSALAAGGGAGAGLRGVARDDRRPAFLFPGFGAQWQGMAVELLDSSPLFAEQMQRCAEALEPHLDWSIEEALRGGEGAPSLHRAEIGSNVLFATMTSLAKLWRACGVEPAVVVGHSQGEVVAAHIAGGLSLEDAAKVAVLRNRALMTLGAGAMASVALPAGVLEPRLRATDGRVEVAAVNGPSATVLTGEAEPLEELVAECVAEGAWAKKIPGAVVASHSVQVEALRDELLESLASISPRSGDIPFHSTVTGEVLDTGKLDADYWYRNLRNAVLLEPVVRSLIDNGCRALLEISPNPVLAAALQETVEATTGDSAAVAVLGTLRREEGGPERFAEAIGEAYVAGVEIDWESFYKGSGARRPALPGYPFQRKHYWLEPSSTGGDVGAAGLTEFGHPWLGTAIELPESDGLQLAGRVSRSSHPWLTEHSVLGDAVVPGAAFVELALTAADASAAGEVAELEIEEPLILPASGSVQLRVCVAAPDGAGCRELTIHSRPEAPSEELLGEGWARHAVGLLRGRSVENGDQAVVPGAEAWPPDGAEQLDVEDIYDRLAEAGFEYGPALRCLRAAWRSGEDLLLEASLSEGEGDAGEFAIHPALLEAVIGAGIELAPGEAAEPGRPAVPVSWHGIALSGRQATVLRARIAKNGNVVAVDPEGKALFSVDSVMARPVEPDRLRAARRNRSLYAVEWSALERSFGAPADSFVTLGEDHEAEGYADLPALLAAVEAGAPVPAIVVVRVHPAGDGEQDPLGAAHANALQAMELAQAWIAADVLGDARLTFVTAGAVAAVEGDCPDLGSAPLWGLVHSARSEHPGRFALIDVDDVDGSPRLLSAALAAGAEEPQLAIRAGELLAPRLVRAQAGGAVVEPFDPEKTVLVTGGLSGIGATVARHLAVRHGVRHLLLTSRRGLEAEGAAELVAELGELGAQATVVACDVADRGRLEALLDSIPAEQPLGAVIHSAAVLDNGVIELLDSERLERVMRPKADAAWYLHEMTEGLALSHFVLFSSVAGIIGNAAQANYAAANVFLDALAAYRQAGGLPGTSMAWGGWMQGTSLVDAVNDVDRARLGRSGLSVFSSEQGLDLFDYGLEAGAPVSAPVSFDAAALRARSEAGMLAPILGRLVRTPADRPRADGPLLERLDGVPEDEREAMVLELVRGQVAVVLGYDSPQDVGSDLVLQELGFDSLGAVELRNRLTSSTGISVPILALSDHPTPSAIARYLLARLADLGTVGDGASLQDHSPSKSNSSDVSFMSLLGEAEDQESLVKFVDLLTAASRFYPTFESPSSNGHASGFVRLSGGPEHTPSLILIPSIGPMSGPQEYVKLARELGDSMQVMTLPLPGFASGESLPGSAAAAIEAQSAAIMRAGLGAELVLGGHSSGGWLAHGIADHLAAAGMPPSAVLLLDTYPPDSEVLSQMLPVMLAASRAVPVEEMRLDDKRLIAMGGYRRIFGDWRPGENEVPTVMVRASEPAWDPSNGHAEEWRAAWGLPHTLVDASGNHFSMMTEHAAGTAEAVRVGFESIGLFQKHDGL